MSKQIIRIEVTWQGWQTLRLNALIAWLANLEGLDIKRIEVKEPKK